MTNSYCLKILQLAQLWKKGYQNVKSATENEKLIQGIADNFDCHMSSPNGQTHSMAVIVTQEQLLTKT